MTNDFIIQFPVFAAHPSLHYLDTAASALTPQCVIDAINTYYSTYSVNAHRGLYDISAQTTQVIERARKRIADLHGALPQEIVFTSGATQGLNAAADMLRPHVDAHHSIVLTRLEHHANILPWQRLSRERGATLRYIDVHPDGTIDDQDIESLITEQTKIVAFTLMSNVIGTVTPAKKIIARARQVGAYVVMDVAQAIAHMPVNVQAYDVDIMAWSGHKVYGPTGVGVLYIRNKLQPTLEPYLRGGHMVAQVTDTNATWVDSPDKFEAGTAPIASIFGLEAAVDFITRIGYEAITAHESQITRYLHTAVSAVPGVTVHGNGEHGILSFTMDTVHAHDVAQILSRHGVAVRAGHHCASLLMRRLGVTNSVRVSIGVYTTIADIDALIRGLQTVRTIFHI